MPIYEYICEACKHTFEALHRSMSDRSVPACPACGAKRVTRRLSVFAARGTSESPASRGETGGCPRCGDPQGPCGSI
ncbi:MAG: zinc ribbon domain-containing protein [Planctomycetota bacterium]|nr:MAG: zinc ribbon domain-containing protein [Planctomycetota bacterium]